MRWYVQANGQTSGPVDDNTLAAWVRERRLAPGTLIAAEGTSEWVPIERSPFAAAMTAPAPPVRKPGMSTLGKVVLALAGLGTLAFGSCVVCVGVGAKGVADTSKGANRALAATPAATAESVSESCLDLSTKFGTSSKLSDLQKDELWKNYKGKSFAWPLQITEVSSGTFGGYSVQAKCSPESPSLIQDIHISYGKDAKDLVMGLEKGATYTLKGTLTRQSPLLGLSANGAG